MNVDLIDHMGSDLTVVNAARVSFYKESDWEEFKSRTPGGPDATPVEQYDPFEDRVWSIKRLRDRDKKLIAFLAREGHWSPFAHCFLQFRIKAPIFVARQLVKHQVGLSWNEVSRRYVDSEPEFYTPSTWRKRAEDKKQGSSDEVVERISDGVEAVDPGLVAQLNYYGALQTYQTLLDGGVCPEQARMVLPQAMMTEWYWSGSLFAFARVCRERLAHDAQKETREVAQGIAAHCGRLFPVSWKELVHAR